MSLGRLDLRLLVYARTRGHSRALDRAVSAFSRTGEHAGLWLAIGGAGAARERDPVRRARWWRGVRVTAFAYGLNTAVKYLVRRPRPELAGLPPLTPTVSRLSFPSAHATTSFAAAGAYRGVLPGAVRYGLAAAFAVSRPYLGVHYPSDVVAGTALGALLAATWPEAG